MANICSSTPIRDTSIKGLTAELNFLRSTICTLQSQVINGGGGGGPTIYTGDGSLQTDRVIALNGHSLKVNFTTDVSSDYMLRIDPNSKVSVLSGNDNTDGGPNSNVILYGDLGGEGVKATLVSSVSPNQAIIVLNGETSTATYTADIHTFNVGMTITELAGIGTRAIAVDSTGKIVLL